jgi:hypothetical protein
MAKKTKAQNVVKFPYKAKKYEKLKTWKFFRKHSSAKRYAGKNGIIRYRGK